MKFRMTLTRETLEGEGARKAEQRAFHGEGVGSNLRQAHIHQGVIAFGSVFGNTAKDLTVTDLLFRMSKPQGGARYVCGAI